MEILKIEDYSLEIKNKKILKSINLSLESGKVLGIVGKSGSGKTTLISAILNILGDNWIKMGRLEVRTDEIALIPQNFNSAFNPLMKIKNHLYELMGNIPKREKKEKAIEVLNKVKIVNPELVLNLYPHELSGGMLQRINIAFALIMDSKLIIADEFTSSLDTIIQDEILKLLYEIQKKEKKTMIIISHDIKVISELSDEICVINKGEIVEYGKREEVLFSPEKEYTKKLISEDFQKYKKDRVQEEKKVLVEIKNLYKNYGEKRVLTDVNLDIFEKSSMGIVGESGNGKSTLAKILLGIEKFDKGEINYSEDIKKNSVQIIFQNTLGSLNPYRKIKKILSDVTTDRNKMIEILKEVGLDEDSLEKYPKQFSGGQVQRICIARALLSEPKLLVLDEPTSSLDKTTQIQILNLLKKIRKDKDISYLIISHNLEVIESLCDTIIVMYQGEVVEKIENTNNLVINNEYSQRLLNSLNRE